jgi:hypothetical protein
LKDPDPLVRGTDPDPYQNITDPLHCLLVWMPEHAAIFSFG